MKVFFVTPWTVARQAPLSMGFSRQEYWSGLPFPSPGDLPNPGIEPGSPALQVDSLPSLNWEAQFTVINDSFKISDTNRYLKIQNCGSVMLHDF